MDVANEGCPTAILIDISPPSGFCLSDNHVSNSTQHFEENEQYGCKIFDNQEKELDGKFNHMNSCESGSPPISSNTNEVQNQMAFRRLRWKTPSPKSMSRISKEASKVIDHLTSSSIFDEDLLLTEEILPTTLNFDELDDDDDADQENSCDNVFEDANSNDQSSVNEKLENKTEKKTHEKLNSLSSPIGTSKEIEDNQLSLLETNTTEVSFHVSSRSNANSKESGSSEIHSSYLDNSDSLTYSNEADNVFHVEHIASEDKENVQNKKSKLIFNKENKIVNKTVRKNLLVNKSSNILKRDQRGTLRNLSNITPDGSVKSLSLNKNVTTPLKRMSISANKVMVSHAEKLEMKKPRLSVDYHHSLIGFSQSKSIKFQNTKEFLSNTQKPQSTIKVGSGCSSSSSDVKQNSVFVTPSRRYSICTPMKSASAMKPPLTPALTSAHNFVFPRYTPQPAKPSRLSFSRSWQQPGNTSQCFPTRGFKSQVSTAVPSSSISKVASGIKKSSETGKLSFSRSMSSVPSRSLGNKGRFTSKLLSPSSMEQDKKVARALFTTVSEGKKINKI